MCSSFSFRSGPKNNVARQIWILKTKTWRDRAAGETGPAGGRPTPYVAGAALTSRARSPASLTALVRVSMS